MVLSMKQHNSGLAPETEPAAGKRRMQAVQRADFWFSVMVLVFVVEFFITVAALCYGIITTPPRKSGEAVRLVFPWVGWLAAMLTAPAILAGLAQLVAGRGDTDASPQALREEAWAGKLPPKALQLYRFFKNAPLFVISLAFIILGATLVTIDSALAFVSGIALALIPYAPYFIGGVTVFAVAIAGLSAWFRHKNNQLMAEYAFRREVLEKTGVILVDNKGKAVLPPGSGAEGYSIGRISASGSADGPIVDAEPLKALPVGEETKRPG